MTQTQPQQRNFLGIPIEGDGDRDRHHRTPQRPLEELQPIIQAVLNDPTVRDFGWRQYTPYFNDGEPCYFSVHGFWLRTVEDVKEDEEDYPGDSYEYEIGYGHPSLGTVYSKWDSEVVAGTRLAGEYSGPDKGRYDRCRELSAAIEGGAFIEALYELFGDHVGIQVLKDKIVVEEYSHD